MSPEANEAQIQKVKLTFLSRVPIFRGIPEPTLKALLGIMSFEGRKAGDLICEQGGPGDACFVIGKGQVQVEVVIRVGNEAKVVATLGAGQVMGEVALLDGRKRSATLRCITDVTLFILRREDFEMLLFGRNQGSMRLLFNLAHDLARRVREVNDRYGNLFTDDKQTIATLTDALEQLRSETEATEAPDEDMDLLKLVGYQGQGAPSSR